MFVCAKVEFFAWVVEPVHKAVLSLLGTLGCGCAALTQVKRLVPCSSQVSSLPSTGARRVSAVSCAWLSALPSVRGGTVVCAVLFAGMIGLLAIFFGAFTVLINIELSSRVVCMVFAVTINHARTMPFVDVRRAPHISGALGACL